MTFRTATANLQSARISAIALLAAGLALAPAGLAQAQEGTVTVYTAFADAVNALAPVFTEKTGIEVQVVAAGSGELIQRVRAESARPLGDVVVSIGGEGIDNNAELFEAYVSTEDSAILADLQVSGNWIPFSVTIPTVLAVNTDLVAADEIPASWADLTDAAWADRVAFAGADKSGSALIQMLQIIHTAGGIDAGWPLFEQMFSNFIVTGSSGAVSRGVAQGEYAVGLTLEDNAQRFIDGGSPMVIVYPSEGIALSADAMALIANGPNPDAGKAFLDFVASAEGQAVIVEQFGRRPIRADVAGPAGGLEAADLPVNNPDPAWVQENSASLLDQYLELARQ